MQKLMRNWIFTLVVCILLAMFAVLLLLDNLGVTGEKYIAYQVIHVMTAVALAIYVILALCPMVPRYRGAAIPFLLFEIVMLSITAIAQLGVQFFRDIPWISDMAVCSVLGFALWLRAAILLVRAYLLQARQPKNSEKKEEEKNTEKTTQKPAKKKKKVVTHTPLWQFCLYIIVAAIGVWQMVKPLISDHTFIYYIAAAAALFAALFAVATVQNRRALPKKEKKATKTAEEPAQPVVVAPVAELSTSATEEPAQPAAEPPVIESPKTEKE